MRTILGMLAACVLALTACGAPLRAQSGTRSPTPTGYSASAVASSSPRFPEPTSQATYTRTTPDPNTVAIASIPGLTCILPVGVQDPVTGNPRGGFINFQTRRFAADPTSTTRWSPSASVDVTVAQPVLDGGVQVYDWALRRWVPAGNPQVISPDGSAYVYTQDYGSGGAMSANRLRIVTVATGKDRLIYTGAFADWPIAWTSAGIYDVALRFEAPTLGLWLIDPVTGLARTVTNLGEWDVISDGAAWGFTGSAFGPAGDDPHTVDRLDLATGKVTNWYSAPYPHNVYVVGLDTAGRPVIVVDHNHVDRLLGPFRTEAMFTSPVMFGRGGSRLQLDSHGLWFASTSTGDVIWAGVGPLTVSDVWLYSYATGLRKVAEITGYTDPISNIAGPCR